MTRVSLVTVVEYRSKQKIEAWSSLSFKIQCHEDPNHRHGIKHQQRRTSNLCVPRRPAVAAAIPTLVVDRDEVPHGPRICPAVNRSTVSRNFSMTWLSVAFAARGTAESVFGVACCWSFLWQSDLAALKAEDSVVTIARCCVDHMSFPIWSVGELQGNQKASLQGSTKNNGHRAFPTTIAFASRQQNVCSHVKV
jgi:hypothetical protein